MKDFLSTGCYVRTRSGSLHGPIRKSPMSDGYFFAPDGYHWTQEGALVGFNLGGNMDVVEVVALPPNDEAALDSAMDAMEAKMRDYGSEPTPWRTLEEKAALREVVWAGIAAYQQTKTGEGEPA